MDSNKKKTRFFQRVKHLLIGYVMLPSVLSYRIVFSYAVSYRKISIVPVLLNLFPVLYLSRLFQYGFK
jgi:hypothetical protein